MKKCLGLFIILIGLCCKKNDEIINHIIEKQTCPDCIVAGDSINNLFTDLIPDTALYVSGMGEAIYELDLDGNNINDFQIKVYAASGTSHSFSDIEITPYGNNGIARGDSVPATYTGDTLFYMQMAQGVNQGDTINNSLDFRNSNLKIYINSSLTSMYTIRGNWNNRSYIPVRLELGHGSVYYGWIKVSDISGGEITIESFATNIP